MNRALTGTAGVDYPPREQRAKPVAPASPIAPGDGYFEESARPLTSLVFVLPMILMYEVGTRWYAVDPVSHVELRIKAFSLMQQFFGLFGDKGLYMPPLAVGSILLWWHLARGDSWTTNLTVLLRMPLECATYAVPLVGMGFVFAKYLPLSSPVGNWKTFFVLSLGAGVYEELVFRLAAFSLMSVIFNDLLKMERKRSFVLMILISSLAFAAYHYMDGETFKWRSFVFRTVAGIYFGLLFVGRGFGVAAGTHAVYDIIIVSLRVLGPA